MRIFGFAFLIAIFLVNTVVVSAWAKPCLNGGTKDIPIQSQSMMDMPCEDMQQGNNQNDMQHCDGVCFCLHVSTHQSPTLNNSLSLSMTAQVSMKYDFVDDRFAGIPKSTLKRPPRA